MSENTNPELIERLADYESRIVKLEAFRNVHEEAIVEFPQLSKKVVGVFTAIYGEECGEHLNLFLWGVQRDMQKMLDMTA